MYRRDLLTAEIQKLAEVIAKMLRLKDDHQPAEAMHLSDEALSRYFSLSADDLLLPEPDFESLLANRAYDSAKTDQLGQLLHARFLVTDDPSAKLALAGNMLILISYLETKHHLQSFQNLAIQQQLRKFLSDAN